MFTKNWKCMVVMAGLAAFVVMSATTAGASTIQNTGFTVGGTATAFTSVDFGDGRGAIPIANLVPTHAVPTTAGGPGILPEVTDTNRRRIWGPGDATQATALNITGDGDLTTIYQAGEQDGVSSYTLNLYFATPIHTGALADVWIATFGMNGQPSLATSTISGIDMAGTLVDSVSTADVYGENTGLSSPRPANYFQIDKDGNLVGTFSQNQDVNPALCMAVNFNANQTLQGIQIAWTQPQWMRYVAEVRGVDSAPIPEPASISLLAMALLGLLAYAWKRRK